MATRELHKALATETWDLCRAVFADRRRYASMLQENEVWRQSLQLLVAALFYSFRSLQDLPDPVFHQPLDPALTPDAWKAIVPHRETIPDLDDRELVELTSGMHLASASFRISTGIWQARLAADSLTPFAVARDWSRGKLLEYLKTAAGLGCCRLGWRSHSQDDIAGLSLAIVLAHRDAFGHGEQGDEGDEWRKRRWEYLTKVHYCRLLEVQLKLISEGISSLRRSMR
jgi:hypothetical protein